MVKKSKAKKILSIVSVVISAIIFAFAISVFILTMQARAKNRPVELFGYSFAVVVTDSMEPEIMVGDLITVRVCSIDEVGVGDNVVFIGQSGDYKDKCIVHKVVAVSEENGKIELTTKGVHNPQADDDPVTADNFIGLELRNSAALGKIITFLKQPLNWLYIVVILVVLIVLVAQIIRIVKYAKERKSGDDSPPPDEDKKE